MIPIIERLSNAPAANGIIFCWVSETIIVIISSVPFPLNVGRIVEYIGWFLYSIKRLMFYNLQPSLATGLT